MRDSTSKTGIKTIEKYRCTTEEALKSGLTVNDKCKVLCNDSSLTCYAFPTEINYDNIRFELAQAKKKYEMKIRVNTPRATKVSRGKIT